MRIQAYKHRLVVVGISACMTLSVTAVDALFGVVSSRYKAFRDAEGNTTEFYWQLLCIRLVFVILFEVRSPLSSHLR